MDQAHRLVNNILAFARSKKTIFFGGMGYIGGTSGALVAEIVRYPLATSMLYTILNSSIWGAVCVAGISISLRWALTIYAGQLQPSRKVIFNSLMHGVFAGLIGAGIAQTIFGFNEITGSGRIFFQSCCWGLLGLILGWKLSKYIPNFKTSRAIFAGLIGGFLGGIGFIVSGSLIADFIGRLIGIGILGAALGLALVIAESMFREASLEVIWAPREITTFSLGPRAISIGGGDDHVHVPGLRPQTASIAMDAGKIFYFDNYTGKKTELRDDSRIKVGKIEVIVHAKH